MSDDAAPPVVSAETADAIRQSARSGAPDRYLAALLAPISARDDLIVLAAFSAEMEKIARQVNDSTLGEIRIQWWRDALEAGQLGQKSGHPIADAFASVIAQKRLPLKSLDGYFDAHTHRMYADPPEAEQHLSHELDLIEGTIFSLATQIIGQPAHVPDNDILHAAAQSYGLARLGLDLPYARARGRNPLPIEYFNDTANADWRAAIDTLIAKSRTHLEHARSAYSSSPRAVMAALLPLALVEPYLRALSRSKRDPTRDIADVAPLTRTWRIAKSHVLGRI